MSRRIIVATQNEILCVDPRGAVLTAEGLAGERPSCLAADHLGGRAWCGTGHGVFRSDDAGASWMRSGLDDEPITAISVSPVAPDLLWAGTDPTALWRSEDGGERWAPLPALDALPSSTDWSFPPQPDTHHVRWIACHPGRVDRLWVAIEAGALISTSDGGASWRDRVPGGPYDTHELAVHPAAPDTLRVAGGDGYFGSYDGGSTWTSPMDGLDVGYLRSVAIDPGDPDVVVVSAATHPHAAYRAGSSDGRLYRRSGGNGWRRVYSGWPDPPSTIAPPLAAGRDPGELWAADERGVHGSTDAGESWDKVAAFEPSPNYVAAIAVRFAI